MFVCCRLFYSVLNLSDADTVAESRRYLWASRVFVGHPNAAFKFVGYGADITLAAILIEFGPSTAFPADRR